MDDSKILRLPMLTPSPTVRVFFAFSFISWDMRVAVIYLDVTLCSRPLVLMFFYETEGACFMLLYTLPVQSIQYFPCIIPSKVEGNFISPKRQKQKRNVD